MNEQTKVRFKCDLQIDHILETCAATATFGADIRFLWKDWEVPTFSAHIYEGQEMTAWLEKDRTDAWHRTEKLVYQEQKACESGNMSPTFVDLRDWDGLLASKAGNAVCIAYPSA